MANSVWETSANGDGADTLPGELSTLGEHRAQCSARSGRWATVRRGVGQAMGFMSSRLVTITALLLTVVVVWMNWA